MPRTDLIALLVLAGITRAALLATNSVSFHSDEAIVALMARHMLQGDFPIFFYGQAYMGSFNAMSTALGFATLGESVFSLRVVQWVKFLLVVWTGYAAAWHLSKHRVVAGVAGLLLAVPPTLGAIYTATNIGGYAETLIFGHLLLILGYDVATTHHYSRWRWIALGLIAGLAWWTNALVVAFALPVALFVLWHGLRQAERRGQYIGLVALALVFFFVGSAPFWWYDFTNSNAALALYLPIGEAEVVGRPVETPLTTKLIGLALFTVPTVIGMRYPWEASYFLPWLGLPILFVYAVAFYQTARSRKLPVEAGGRFFIFGIPGLLLVVFLLTSFGADPTGRYFLPILLSLGMALGILARSVYEKTGRAWLAALPVLLVIGYNAIGQIQAARTEPGLTTQIFAATEHIPNTYDDELIAFLESENIQHGYASYWVAMRTAFLSGETIQMSSALPYKQDLSYNPVDNRYRPYQQVTSQANRVAYINTSLLPQLDAVLRERFEAQGVTDYATRQIGPYLVYYNFEPRPPRLDFAANPATASVSRR